MVFQSPNPLGSRDADEEVASAPRPPINKGAIMAPDASIESVDDDLEEDYDLDSYEEDSESEDDENQPTPFQKDNRGSSDRCVFVTLWIVMILALGGLAFATVRYVQYKNANRQSASIPTTQDDDFNEILANRDTEAYKLQVQNILADVVKSSTLLTPSSPQAQAVEWMVLQDSVLTLDDLDKTAATDGAGDPYRVYQRYALMALFFATGGELWEDTPWTENGEVHECDFVGVDCDEKDQVVILDLFLRKLRGRLPDDVGLLTQLSSLVLSSNLLEGSIPAFVFDRLTNLGKYPDIAKLTNLNTLALIELSGLTGSLPNSLKSLTNMKDIRLQQTQMTAPIFDFVASWPELENLDLFQSQVTGTIPTTIGVTNGKMRSM
ncbi:MAG: hypothetical protein SGILL_010038 [Bacillariaceae sp.]